MSKQSEAKERQGYNPKPIPQVCKNCLHYQSDFVWPDWIMEKPSYIYRDEQWKTEKNKRCDLGEFPVKKTATCKEYELRGNQE